jgi:hypothetical protein
MRNCLFLEVGDFKELIGGSCYFPVEFIDEIVVWTLSLPGPSSKAIQCCTEPILRVSVQYVCFQSHDRLQSIYFDVLVADELPRVTRNARVLPIGSFSSRNLYALCEFNAINMI